MSIGQIGGILIIANIYHQINGKQPPTLMALDTVFRFNKKEAFILVAAELFNAKEFKEE